MPEPFPADRARRIRLLGLDVDGVLTDNGLWLGSVGGERVELKRYDVQDGLGLVLMRHTDIEVLWLSARPSEASRLRGAELRIGTVLEAPNGRKAPVFEEALAARGLDWSEVAFVGDDLADLAVLQRVGLPIAVANAVPEVRAAAAWITTRAGGHGAVREVVEALLRARGEWDAVVARYGAASEEAPSR